MMVIAATAASNSETYTSSNANTSNPEHPVSSHFLTKAENASELVQKAEDWGIDLNAHMEAKARARVVDKYEKDWQIVQASKVQVSALRGFVRCCIRV